MLDSIYTNDAHSADKCSWTQGVHPPECLRAIAYMSFAVNPALSFRVVECCRRAFLQQHACHIQQNKAWSCPVTRRQLCWGSSKGPVSSLSPINFCIALCACLTRRSSCCCLSHAALCISCLWTLDKSSTCSYKRVHSAVCCMHSCS